MPLGDVAALSLLLAACPYRASRDPIAAAALGEDPPGGRSDESDNILIVDVVYRLPPRGLATCC